MIQFFSNPVWQVMNTDGNPLVGGTLTFYQAGTSTLQDTYPTIADALALTNANSNPITLDSYGMPTTINIVLIPQKSYKLLIKNSAGTTIRTVDNLSFSNNMYGASGLPLLTFTDTASAVNYLNIVSSITGVAPTLAATGSDADVGMIIKPKADGTLSLYTGNSSNTYVDLYRTATAAIARLSLASISAATARTYTYPDFSGTFLLRNGTGMLDSSGNVVLSITANATPVNYLDIGNRGTGLNPTVMSAGSDTNIGIDYFTKGTGTHRFFGGSGGLCQTWLKNTGSGTITHTIAATTGDRTVTWPDSDVTILVSGASASDQETATSTTTAVTPAVQQRHPSAVKAWALWDGTGTPALTASYNCSSITDTGTGDWTVNFTTAMSSAAYAANVCCRFVFGTSAGYGGVKSLATGGVAVQTFASGGSTLTDFTQVYVACYGDQ